MMDVRRRAPKCGAEMGPISRKREQISVVARRWSAAQHRPRACAFNQIQSGPSTKLAQIKSSGSSSKRLAKRPSCVDSTSQLAAVLIKVILVAAALAGFSGLCVAIAQQPSQVEPTSTSPSPAATSASRQQQVVAKLDNNSTTSEDTLLASASTTTARSAPAQTVAPPPSTTTANGAATSDLATSASSTPSLVSAAGNNNKQLVKKSAAAGAPPTNNRWTHFGARLRPLAPVTQLGAIDHHEQAASNAKSSASLALAQGHLRAAQQQVGAGAQRQGVARALPANSLEAGDNSNEEAGDEDDEQDSEALLYKMMQQQNFLMNPSWQEQASGGAAPSSRPPGSNNNNFVPTNQQAQAELANSKKVIKLLKSYSHIHQVDDSDDQIRGTYTRVAARRPELRQQHDERRQNGNQPADGRPRRVQHIYVSSRPVATSQSRLEARTEAGRPQAPDSTNDHDSGSGALDEAQEGGGPPPPPPQDDEEFECPNNGIFADVASGCQSYHVCQSGAQVQEKFQCPLGTLFNDIILTCDFAHNVQCGAAAAAHKKQSDGSTAINRQAQFHHQQQQQQPPQHPREAQSPLPARQPAPQRAHQHQVAAQSRNSAQGPRQLVIGAGQSPYNQHGRPQAGRSSQAQAVGTYPPPASPLSNSIGGQSGQGDERDEDDEPAEPLVPATLPPRVAPQASQARATSPNLPYQAPPPPLAPPTQLQQHRFQHQPQQPRQMPASIQQQIAHQADQRQSAHFSQFPQQARRTQQQQQQQTQRPLPVHSQQTQQRNFNWPSQQQQPQQQPQPQAARLAPFQPANIFYGDSATSASPVFAEPHQPSTERPGAVEHKQPDYNNDAQSFNLVIDHVAPVGNNKLDEVRRLEHPAQAAHKEHRIVAAAAAAAARPQLAGPQEAPVYKSSVDPAQISKAQPQARFNNNPLPPALPPAPWQLDERQQSAPVQQQARQRPGNFAQAQRYEPTREAPKKQRQQQQVAAHFGGATEASQHATAVTHAPASAPLPARGVVDLTRDQAASVAAEAMNDGLLLIVRHSSGSAPLQVAGAHQQKPAAGGSGQAFAVDPTLVRPDSALDAQLFPNVQQLIASSGGGSATQASTLQVSHQLPERAASLEHRQARLGAVRGGLPPMEPPRPVVEYQAAEQQQQQQSADFKRGFADQTGLDQLASSASSAAGSSASALASSTTTSAATSTTPASASKDKPKPKQKQPAAKASAAPAKPPTDQQQATRSKRAKRLKAAQSPAKPARSGSLDTSTANSSTATSSATSTTTPSSPTRSSKSNSAQQQQQASSTPAARQTRPSGAN